MSDVCFNTKVMVNTLYGKLSSIDFAVMCLPDRWEYIKQQSVLLGVPSVKKKIYRIH